MVFSKYCSIKSLNRLALWSINIKLILGSSVAGQSKSGLTWAWHSSAPFCWLSCLKYFLVFFVVGKVTQIQQLNPMEKIPKSLSHVADSLLLKLHLQFHHFLFYVRDSMGLHVTPSFERKYMNGGEILLPREHLNQVKWVDSE